MGTVDTGGGQGAHAHRHGGVSVADLTGPADGEPDVAVVLAARQGTFALGTGERVDGYTLNGTSPGPALQVSQGDLVQVTLTNVDVPDGVTLHWHGVDVPNAEDGVAGVTQDAVRPGEQHVYRFLAEDAGTYWYHSHQVSHAQVRGGLFGTLVVLPPGEREDHDVVAAVHSYDGRRTVNGRAGVGSVAADAGSTVRVRLVNTDKSPLRAWVSGSPFRVVAVDGTDVNDPAELRDEGIVVTAGGRVDVVVTAPARIDAGGGAALVVGPGDADVPARPDPERQVDLLSYGRPAALPFDPTDVDRRFTYDIGRRIGLLDGRP
ncbi:MAG: multicopper oxidase family protein, partial [Actinomycetes bacterium]